MAQRPALLGRPEESAGPALDFRLRGPRSQEVCSPVSRLLADKGRREGPLREPANSAAKSREPHRAPVPRLSRPLGKPVKKGRPPGRLHPFLGSPLPVFSIFQTLEVAPLECPRGRALRRASSPPLSNCGRRPGVSSNADATAQTGALWQEAARRGQEALPRKLPSCPAF